MAASDLNENTAKKKAGSTEEDRIEKKAKKSKVRKAAQKDESSITFYLHASLFLFFLTAYAFLLFLFKNKYPLILNNEILPEVLFFCFGLLVFSFLSLFLLSFWRLLARLFIAVIAGGTIAYILGLLFPYNIGNYVAHYASFLPHDTLMYLAANGNMIAAGVSAFLMFILLNIFKGGAMAFLSLPVLVAIFMLLNTASKQTIPEKIMTAEAVEDREKEKTENLIYLILADHTGYSAAAESWQNLNSKNESPENMPFAPTFIPSFYKENGFTFYPAAYVRFNSKYRNIGAVLNPSLTEITDDLFNRNDAVYYIGSDDALVSAKRNDLFKALKEKGYHLNVYQSYPFDFCAGAEKHNIANCITYPAPLGALYQTGLTTQSRLLLLFGHWLYSTPFGKQASEYLYTELNKKTDASRLPLLGNPMSKSMPVGQSLILSRMRQDILSAKGKNVFFAHLNLPHFPYVYDKNCQIRTNPSVWRSNAPYTDKKELNGELKRWEDYNQQLFCTYAQINYLIKDLKTAKLLDKTSIVIHGDKGAGIQKETADEKDFTRAERMVYRFKNNMTTVFGYYQPKNKAKTDPVPCDISTLVNRHILEKTEEVCQPPHFVSFTSDEQDKAMAWIKVPVDEKYLKTAADYNSVYTPWLENGGQAFIASLDERLKQERENADASKISFVAPPSFMDNQNAGAPLPSVKEKTTSFVPVPEKTEELLPEQSETASPSVTPQTAPVTEKENAPKKNEPSLIEMPLPVLPPPDTEPREVPPATDVIADDLGSLPKPIVLPASSAEDKWKTADIKEGQKTTLELLPQSADTLPVLPEALPPVEDVPPAPQAAPSAQVEIIPLPPVATVEPLPTDADINNTPDAVSPAEQETPEISAAKEARSQAEAAVQETVNEEAKALAAAEAQLKAAEEAKAKAEAAIQARAKADEEARLKAEEEAKARAEEEARLKAEAETQLKAAQEAKAKAEAAAKARAEAEAAAKAKAEEEARIRAEEEARRKAEAEAQIKAAQEAQAKARAEARAAKARAEEEERLKAEQAEIEEMRKKTSPPPPPANADELDIVKETLVERVNEDGEVETFIYLERKPNPKRFKKKEVSAQNQANPSMETSSVRTQPQQTEKTERVLNDDSEPAKAPAVQPQKQTQEKAERVLNDDSEPAKAPAVQPQKKQPAFTERVLDD